MATWQNYGGLYGENQLMSVNEFMHFEALETRSRLYDWEIKEHIHTNLVQIFIVTSGTGYLKSESQSFELAGPTLVFIPSNTLHGFQFMPDVTGQVITLSENYFDGLLKDSPKATLFFERIIIGNLDQVGHLQIENVLAQIEQEWVETGLEKQVVLKYLFQLLFLRFYRIASVSKVDLELTDNRMLQYFHSFQKSVKVSLSENKTIKDYASELNMTTTHLNRICRAVVNKSALETVQEFLVMESKKYLLNTSYTVSEISYLLNFRDPAYFSRFFKNKVGVSPVEFRKNA